MAVSRAKKRPLQVSNRDFLWWVHEDEESLYQPSLHLVTVDGAVFLKMPLVNASAGPYVVTLGSEFRGREMVQGTHRRFLCPHGPLPDAVTPAFVAKIAAWAVQPGSLPDELDWRGETLG